MILFGFEVDTLEIALREQLKFVDKVFIVESTLTHKGVSFLALTEGALEMQICVHLFILLVCLELSALTSLLSEHTLSNKP